MGRRQERKKNQYKRKKKTESIGESESEEREKADKDKGTDCLMCETRKEGNVRRGSGPERTGESRDKREAHCCRTERVEFCPFAAVRSSRN